MWIQWWTSAMLDADRPCSPEKWCTFLFCYTICMSYQISQSQRSGKTIHGYLVTCKVQTRRLDKSESPSLLPSMQAISILHAALSQPLNQQAWAISLYVRSRFWAAIVVNKTYAGIWQQGRLFLSFLSFFPLRTWIRHSSVLTRTLCLLIHTLEVQDSSLISLTHSTLQNGLHCWRSVLRLCWRM